MSEQSDASEYVVGERIAVGGMAELFAAWRADGSGPPLVVKRLLPDGAAQPEVADALEHEGRLMQRVAHENLVRVVDVVARPGDVFLVLERVDGASVAEVLRAMAEQGARPSDAMVLALALPVLEALAHVHGARDDEGAPLDIVHRDVTPQNILVTREAGVRLGDFGIARSSLRDARTRTGVIKGKLRYLAPEQVTGSDVDARTDLYALAVLLWELVAGEPYLEAASDAQLLRAAEEPCFRSAAPRFDAVLRRALSRFVEGRHRDASAMRGALLALTDEAELEEGRAEWRRWVAHAAPSSDALLPPSPEAPARRRPPWVTLGLLGAGLASTVAFGLGLQLSGAEPRVAESRPAPLEAPPQEPPVVEPAPAIAPPAEPVELPPPPAAPPLEVSDEEATPPPVRARRAPTPIAAPEVPGPDPALAAVRAELAAARASLRARGIVDSDLTPVQRRARGLVESHLAAGDGAAARAAWDPLARELSAIAVDDAFVRAKLARVEAAIGAARARGVDTTEIERLSALALQDLLARRPDATNRRLNAIVQQLR